MSGENWKGKAKMLEMQLAGTRTHLAKFQQRAEYLLKFLKEKCDPEMASLNEQYMKLRAALDRARERVHELLGNGGECSGHELKDCPVEKEVIELPIGRTTDMHLHYGKLLVAASEMLKSIARGDITREEMPVWVINSLVKHVRAVEEAKDKFTKMKAKDPEQEVMKKAIEQDSQDPEFRKLIEGKEGGEA